MSVFRFLSARLADDVVDDIFRRVHEDGFEPALSDIRSRRSVFETAIDDGRDPIVALRSAEMHCEDEIDWWSALATYDENKFVFVHDYVENQDTDLFLVEGRVDETTMTIERCYYRNARTSVESFSVKEMKTQNMIPFKWTMDVLGVDRIASHRIASVGNEKWVEPRAVIKWFVLHGTPDRLPSPLLMDYLGL